MLPKPFSLLPDRAFQRLQVARGQSVFHHSDPSCGPWFVERGALDLVRHTRSGVRVLLHAAAAGDVFAEQSIFSQHYHCDCVAAADSIAWRIDKSMLLARIGKDASFAQSLLARMAGQVQG